MNDHRRKREHREAKDPTRFDSKPATLSAFVTSEDWVTCVGRDLNVPEGDEAARLVLHGDLHRWLSDLKTMKADGGKWLTPTETMRYDDRIAEVEAMIASEKEAREASMASPAAPSSEAQRLAMLGTWAASMLGGDLLGREDDDSWQRARVRSAIKAALLIEDELTRMAKGESTKSSAEAEKEPSR